MAGSSQHLKSNQERTGTKEWAITLTDPTMQVFFFFLKECERLYNFGLGIDCNTIIWDLVFILVGAWKTTMLRSIWRIEAQIKWFQMGAIVETAREAVHVIFGKECSCLMQLF